MNSRNQSPAEQTKIEENRPIRRKLVVIGDGACGKTSLLLTYKKNEFQSDYVPTVFENTHATVQVEQRVVDLALWDTAGKCSPLNLNC